MLLFICVVVFLEISNFFYFDIQFAVKILPSGKYTPYNLSVLFYDKLGHCVTTNENKNTIPNTPISIKGS